MSILKKTTFLVANTLSGIENKILKNSSEFLDNHGINAVMENKNVYQSLINGEVTEEVQALRYSSYKILENSHNFQHIGNGASIKKKTQPLGKNVSNKINFIEYNKKIYRGIADSIDDKCDYSDLNEEYLFNYIYNEFSTCKLEKYTNFIKVNGVGNNVNIELNINKPFNGCDFSLKAIHNTLKRNANHLHKCDFLNINKIKFYRDNNETFRDVEITELKIEKIDDTNVNTTSLYFNGVLSKNITGYNSDKFIHEKTKKQYETCSKRENSTLDLRANFS